MKDSLHEGVYEYMSILSYMRMEDSDPPAPKPSTEICSDVLCPDSLTQSCLRQFRGGSAYVGTNEPIFAYTRVGTTVDEQSS